MKLVILACFLASVYFQSAQGIYATGAAAFLLSFLRDSKEVNC